MGAKRVEYQIVGRYMSGKEVTGYHLQSIETGKSGKFSRDQIAFLIGREQITNCTAQIYQDKVLLRGKGMSLEDLPIQYEDGTTKNTEQLGKVTKGADVSQVMEKFTIVGAIKSGRNTVGYIIQNAGCGIKRIKRQQVIELAQQGKIANARVQMYQGKPLLRGVGCNLDTLPSENIDSPETNTSEPKNRAKQIPNKNNVIYPLKTKLKGSYRTVYEPMEIQDKAAKYAIGIRSIKYDRETGYATPYSLDLASTTYQGVLDLAKYVKTVEKHNIKISTNIDKKYIEAIKLNGNQYYCLKAIVNGNGVYFRVSNCS